MIVKIHASLIFSSQNGRFFKTMRVSSKKNWEIETRHQNQSEYYGKFEWLLKNRFLMTKLGVYFQPPQAILLQTSFFKQWKLTQNV